VQPFAAKTMGDSHIERVVSFYLWVKLVGDKPMLRQAMLLVGMFYARVPVAILHSHER
jgi:hypothetical protein